MDVAAGVSYKRRRRSEDNARREDASKQGKQSHCQEQSSKRCCCCCLLDCPSESHGASTTTHVAMRAALSSFFSQSYLKIVGSLQPTTHRRRPSRLRRDAAGATCAAQRFFLRFQRGVRDKSPDSRIARSFLWELEKDWGFLRRNADSASRLGSHTMHVRDEVKIKTFIAALCTCDVR